MQIVNYFENLRNKISDNQIKIGIIGLGYVGLPLSITFAESNIKVLGFDIDKEKVININDGFSYLKHIDSTNLNNLVNKKILEATFDFSRINEIDIIIICVPTPLTKYRDPDLSFILNTLKKIKKFLKKGQLISLESTTYPGTTEEVLKVFLEEQSFILGDDFFLVYSPEREDPGNKKFNTKNIPKVLGGITNNCTELGKMIYEKAIDKIFIVSDTKVAEFTKLLENIHRSVNIGLMNELKQLSERMDIDLYEVIKAASTKPFGFVPYYPGPGLGGHCIPIDPFYLAWKAKEFGMQTKFIELAGEINTYMPNYVVKKTIDALNRNSKPLNNSKLLILGISYKKNIDDCRESPALEIIYKLVNRGAKVNFNDPFFPTFPSNRKYDIKLKSSEISPKELSKYDAVVLTTDHDNFDYEIIKKYSQLIIDTRGRFPKSENVIRA